MRVEVAAVDPWTDGERSHVSNFMLEHELVEVLVDPGGVEVIGRDGEDRREEQVLRAGSSRRGGGRSGSVRLLGEAAEAEALEALEHGWL